MTKVTKRFNKKGRLNRKIEIEEEPKSSKIQIEGIQEQVQLENDTNMLVLPSKKRKTKVMTDHTESKKQLTKKQRKNFEKVIERKEKFLKRDDLLKKLSEVQVDSNEMQLYASVKDIGKKEKRKFNDCDGLDDDFDLSVLTSQILKNSTSDNVASSARVINSISGSNKQKYKKMGASKADSKASDRDTDEYSTDSEINEEEIQAALCAKQKKSKATLESLLEINEKIKVAIKAIDSEEEKDLQMVAENTKPLVNRKATYVHVERLEEVKESRSKLPIITEEQTIMEKIFDNEIVIIW
jgi:ATP-dependent RNA helicase DHX37/DHR1